MNFNKTIKGTLVLTLALQWAGVSAQSDSITVTKAKWSEKKIAKDVKLKHYWFDHSLFAANQTLAYWK